MRKDENLDMNFLKKMEKGFNSHTGSYVFYILAAAAFAFLKSAEFAYGWIAELYPLGDKFVPVMLGITGTCAVISVAYIMLLSFVPESKSIRRSKILKIIHIIIEILSAILFIYTTVLLFGFDKGISLENISTGVQYLAPNLAILGMIVLIPLPLIFCEKASNSGKALIASVLIAALTIIPLNIDFSKLEGNSNKNYPAIRFQSENSVEAAQITYESLKDNEKADAINLLDDGNKCWTAQKPDTALSSEYGDINNSVAEIQLKEAKTFNTAVIEETGNQVQYFRLQAYINDEWITVYQSEKIQSLKICSFDAVTTDKVRLSIDKFRDDNTPARIKSLKLYNEPARSAEDFEVTAYQRIDGDVPTEILSKGDAYVDNYAKFYDVYSTVILFGAVNWDENGNISFGEKGEENFAKQVEALKEIISHRSNKNHQVKLIITALADGTGGSHGGVNVYMGKNMETIADQIISLVNKYDFDGVDIDWEYPASAEDWSNFDKFIAKLDEGMNTNGKDRILSAALSAWNLGLSQETFDRLDQIQFMAYDGNDKDGYQSSLQQAQDGIADFANNGADISKINIGIAAYGRPINSTPFWATWRDLEQANYWDSKYYNVADCNQIYEGTFCSPALAGDKTAYALLTGCGGVMVFRVACDKTMDDPNSVACGIQNTLNRYITNW